MLKLIAHLSLFLAGIALVDVQLREMEPLPFWSWSRNKVNWVTEHGEEFDTMFFGSSRMHYGLRPDEFDARMAELGRPTKSFNFALSGMRMHDVVHMIDWLLERKPSSLKRVVLELHSFDQAIRGHQWFSDQDLEMHSPEVLGMRLKSVLISNNPVTDKASQIQYVLLHTISNALRLGQGTRIVADWLSRSRGERLPKAYDVAQHGWQDVATVQLPHMVKEHEQFAEHREGFERQVSWKVQHTRIERLEGGFHADAVRSVARKLRANGIEPIFVVMPTLSCDFHGRDGVAEVAKEVRILELDDPAPNRAVYDLGFYYDASHLDADGALRFSRYLADLVVGIESTGSAPLSLARAMPTARPTLEASWKDGKRDSIAVRVDGLPFVGDVFAAVGEPAEGSKADGVPLAFALPQKIHAPMQRDLLYAAHAEIDATQLPQGLPLVVQACVILDGKLVLASEPVRIEPR